MKQIPDYPIHDIHLKEAIAILTSPCFETLNALETAGTGQSTTWVLIRTVSLVDIVEELELRGIDISHLPCSVERDRLVVNQQVYKYAKEILNRKRQDEKENTEINSTTTGK